MDPERYQQVERLFHAALEHPAEERDAFIHRACVGDEELRRDVESLLASDYRSPHFIEEPPREVAAALLAEEQQHSLVGRTLAHYQILSKLGAGGMGEVYLAEDKKLGRNVAIKLLHAESVADERANKRLMREAQAAAKLDHPNICAIHEVREESGFSFIVMPYVEGKTLADLIYGKPLEVREVLNLAVQVADALAVAHSRGITHRDIKPENIMVTSREHAKVMDFGLARLEDQRGPVAGKAETESFVTQPGTIIGTIPYMSPEQVKAEAIDGRSDVFSFGAVLYEITTGKHPFEAASGAETISAILKEDPRPLAQYAANVPQELQRIVAKCLEKDRERRYQSTSDLTVDLRNLKNEMDSGVPVGASSIAKRQTHHKWIYAIIVLAILALSAFAFYFPRRERQTHSLAIMPFVNTGGDPNKEYLCDGITESLINSFSRLPQLKVIARTTAFRYKGKDADPQIIGRDLHVDAMVTGRVIQQGDTLIVQADLLSTADGSQLWGEKYSRKLSDLFAVQEQIANEIADKLQFKLTGEEKQALSKRYTENINAYQNYLLGWTHLQRRTGDDFLSAIGYFEKAIEDEPTYALAYAALTEAYASLTTRGLIEPLEGKRKMEDAARKALSLDPNLAEAHVAIAQPSLYFPPYSFSTGERELRYAIQLNPSMTQAYLVLGASLLEQGRLDEALEVWSKARELDPLSPIIARLEAFTYLMKRDYPRSLELLRHSKVLGPPFIIWGEVGIYVQNGRLDEVVADLGKAKLERNDDSYVSYSAGVVAAARGERAAALQIIKNLQQSSGTSLHRAMLIAIIYCELNEKELALAWLERGLNAGAITIFYKDAPAWDPIRGDQRFRDLLRRMGLPQ